jgi:electron transfer flavoprotein beta subunit
MEIYVLVKQVPDPKAIIKVKSVSELEIENKYFTNFFDEIAIEAGLKVREKSGGKVTVLTVDNKKVDASKRGNRHGRGRCDSDH